MNTLFITVLVLVGAYVLYELVRIVPLVQESKRLVQSAQPFESELGETSILVIGDSTAVGIGSSPEESVAGRLANFLDASVENKAKSGAKTADIQKQFLSSKKESYNLVVLHVGANDVLFFTPGAKAEKELGDVLPHIREKSDRVVLLTAGKIQEAPLIPLFMRPIYAIRTQHMRERFKRIAGKYNVTYIDLYALPDPFKEDPKRYYAPDMLHLSGHGYSVWFEHIRDEIFNRWPGLAR